MAILTEIQKEEDQEEVSTTIYDIFLSFRGIDTRLTFIDHLYQALLTENICTFLDEEEVSTGEELKPELTRAIKNSRASIIVLSENYASSTWCLDELVMIMEQRRTSDHFVLPIFYHVEPTHVRKQQNSFGDALMKHKERMEAENDDGKKNQGARKLELWTKALTHVADLKGKDANGRRETVFIKEIVKEVSSKLDLNLRSKVSNLIGMRLSILTIVSWLKEGSSKTGNILSIWGMAGIGKTHLAKYIYNLHSHEFEGSSFLEGVERKCAQQSSALLDLLKQLLGDILKRSMIEVYDANVYTVKIEKALSNKKLLLVLDGIDSFSQLDWLIGTEGGFHPGSKIIITTKDRSLTEKSALFRTPFPPEHETLELNGLTDTESLKLLCSRAFGGNGPKEGYEEESKKVSKYCQGHPLALIVLGSSLINEDVANWRDTCDMLERKEYYSDILKVLRISYDSLPSENNKEMFKHIACFFVGEDKEVTETILKECGIHTSSGMTKLVDRCLVTVDGNNLLHMHQLIQDMGRDLVYQESPTKPWKRSRLWNHEDSFNVLKEGKRTKKIQGLALSMKMLKNEQLHGSNTITQRKLQDDMNKNFTVFTSFHRVYRFFSNIWWFFTWFLQIFLSAYCKKIDLTTDALKKMEKLNLLQLNHVKLYGSYEDFPKGLIWLRMHEFHLKYIPSNLPMANLVALDMSYSDLEQLWKKPKLLGSLKVLNLSYSKLVSIGGFSYLPSLERLILTGCASLIHVCESIGQCEGLVILDMSNCNRLKKLPSSIGKLKKVETLAINGCVNASESPIEMKDMESLKVLEANSMSIELHASSSFNTKLVPRSPQFFLLSLPPSLVTLSLKNNNLSNESFPTNFSSLSMLKELYLDRNPIHSMPDFVRSLVSLEVLSAKKCSMLKSVLCPPTTLKYLYTSNCPSLVNIHFHPEMSSTPYIAYKASKSLTEIQGLIKIQALVDVDEEILCRLGWRDLHDVKYYEVKILDDSMWYKARKLSVQMYYEHGIFSTFFPGKEIPSWFPHRNRGSFIAFTMRSSPSNKKIVGLNLCVVHESVGRTERILFGARIRNLTKKQIWNYSSYINAIQEADEDIVWLSHWMFGNNEIEDGDEVRISTRRTVEFDSVRECAISLMYDDEDTEEDPLDYYKSWKRIIGGDLSEFQSMPGYYSLCTDDFIMHPGYSVSTETLNDYSSYD